MLKETTLDKIKSIFKTLDSYPGEWDLGNGLKEISLTKNGINLFETFLNRYYYISLDIVFKDEKLVKSLDYGICSLPSDGYRKLYFSKRTFLHNLIPNIDDVINANGECAYRLIKKSLRAKKDIYRDVYSLGKKSKYYDEVYKEYERFGLSISFQEYVSISKKKYIRLLNGYNALLEIFNKPIDINKFLSCFDPEQLYLYISYTLLKLNIKYLELYSKLDFTIKYVDEYIKYVQLEKKNQSFYNSHIVIDSKKNTIYTIDDLIKEYNELMTRVLK